MEVISSLDKSCLRLCAPSKDSSHFINAEKHLEIFKILGLEDGRHYIFVARLYILQEDKAKALSAELQRSGCRRQGYEYWDSLLYVFIENV